MICRRNNRHRLRRDKERQGEGRKRKKRREGKEDEGMRGGMRWRKKEKKIRCDAKNEENTKVTCNGLNVQFYLVSYCCFCTDRYV